MIGGALIEAAARRDRLLVLGLLVFVVLLCWAYLFAGAGMTMPMGDMLMPMSMGPWSVQHAAVVGVMWAAMMAAMMLPSAAPMILLHATLARRGGTGSMATISFAAGYLLVWSAFSVGATALQYLLESAALLSPMMQTTSIALTGSVLIAAGLYQWTPFKQACLRLCRSPFEFITTYWRPGSRGALRMGLHHGLYCVGCCWMLMLLLFVGGVMSLAWIAAIALFVLVEKIAPAGHWIGKAAGAAFVVWGVATLLAAS